MEKVIKNSHKRDLIKEAMCGRKDHPTAATIYSELKSKVKDLSLATVYRNLNLLVENGDLKRLTFDSEDHFDPEVRSHHHFVCKGCGKILDIDESNEFEKFEKKLEDDFEGEITSLDLTIYGYCKECLKSKKNIK